MESFTVKLASLGVTELPSIASAHPDQNPLDIFRTHIAARLATLAGVEPEAVFAGLDRATKPESGDFVLAVPRLRIKRASPQELGEKWQAEVHTRHLDAPFFFPFIRLLSVWRVPIIGQGRFSGIIYAILCFE